MPEMNDLLAVDMLQVIEPHFLRDSRRPRTIGHSAADSIGSENVALIFSRLPADFC